MDQKRIGKLIAECRKEKNLTQSKLASMLGVTDKSVSKWENGNCLPDVSLYKQICEILGITLNEFFAGEKLTDENFKKVSDENLYNALENSAFTLKDRQDYFKKKWQREHFFELIIITLIIVFFIIYGFIKDNGLQYLFMVFGFICSMLENNRMSAYIEQNAYRKISNQDFNKSIKKFYETKEVLEKFDSKEEAVSYLVKETKLSKKECSNAYDIIINLDIKTIKKDI